jgi:hypothetical protein
MPSRGMTSICFPSFASSSRSRVKKDLPEVCALSGRDISARAAPYPPGYRAAFAFSSIFYPPRHRPSLRLALPPKWRRDGLTVFRVFDTMGQVPTIPRRRLCPCAPIRKGGRVRGVARNHAAKRATEIKRLRHEALKAECVGYDFLLFSGCLRFDGGAGLFIGCRRCLLPCELHGGLLLRQCLLCLDVAPEAAEQDGRFKLRRKKKFGGADNEHEDKAAARKRLQRCEGAGYRAGARLRLRWPCGELITKIVLRGRGHGPFLKKWPAESSGASIF